MFDINTILQTGGLLMLALVVFAESGLLIGLFLPGDTLLLTAGLFAGQHKISLLWLLLVVIISAIIGYEVGYVIGEKAGPRLFRRKDGILFREEYIERTNKYFNKYGPITVVIARFIAHVRTLVSVIAGTAKMDRRTYFIYNVIGAILWAGSLILLGDWLGGNVPNIDRYFFPFILASLVVIYSAVMWELLKSPARRKGILKGIKEDFNYITGRSKNF